MSRSKLLSGCGVSLAFAAVSLFGAVSDFPISPKLNQPIGVTYSPIVNKLIFSQPFCGKTNRQLIAVSDTGAATVFANLPARVSTPVHADCWEDYVAVSSGLGGFTNGAVFVTQGQNIVQVPPTGGSATLFAHIPDLTDTHTGITFDTVGTFGFQMLITGQNGKMYSISSAGVVTPVADTTGLASPAEVGIENGSVAPLTWGVYGGWFIVSAEDRHKVFAVNPSGSPSQHQVITLASNFQAPETVHFTPTILQNWGASGGVFFDIIFNYNMATQVDTTKVVKFPASDFLSYQGQAIVPQEENGQINVIYAFTLPVTMQSANIGVFTSGLGQQEGSTFVTQPAAAGCTYTQGAYKNNFSSKVVALNIGGTTYTAAQLLEILGTPVKGNAALSLAHQLITAKLNVYWGASVPAAVATAIVSADQLLATVTTNVLPVANKLPPIGTAFLSPSATTDALTQTLDNYNSGLTGPGHCQD